MAQLCYHRIMQLIAKVVRRPRLPASHMCLGKGRGPAVHYVIFLVYRLARDYKGSCTFQFLTPRNWAVAAHLCDALDAGLLDTLRVAPKSKVGWVLLIKDIGNALLTAFSALKGQKLCSAQPLRSISCQPLMQQQQHADGRANDNDTTACCNLKQQNTAHMLHGVLVIGIVQQPLVWPLIVCHAMQRRCIAAGTAGRLSIGATRSCCCDSKTICSGSAGSRQAPAQQMSGRCCYAQPWCAWQ
jgi:hypothetical protein